MHFSAEKSFIYVIAKRHDFAGLQMYLPNNAQHIYGYTIAFVILTKVHL